MLQMNPGVQYPHREPPRTAISCCTGCSSPGSPSPSAVTISWPSSEAIGTRQALIATHSVEVLRPGRAIRTEQAPHSPSAQPSLQPVSPHPRRKSSAVVWSGTSVIDALCPLIVTLPATISHAPVRPEKMVGCPGRALTGVDMTVTSAVRRCEASLESYFRIVELADT